MKQLFLSALLFIAPFITSGAEIGGILQQSYEKEGVAQSFEVGGDWYPYPQYSDRTAWDKLLNADAKKAYITNAEKHLGYKWQHIPASTFLALKITGDKQQLRKIELKNRSALVALMMGELAEGKGRFLNDLADGLWFYGTEFHWSISNQTKGGLPCYDNENIALGNVKVAVTVSVAWHFFHEELDKMDPAISEAVQANVKRIILDPALYAYGTKDFHWMGRFATNRLNNWNPWCNHGVLLAFLLMEKDQERLDIAVRESVANVDNYLRAYQEDGACAEGAGYWGQSVGRFCEYLLLLKQASRGKFNVLPNAFISKMALFPSRTYIGTSASGKNYRVNFADGNHTGGFNPLRLYEVGDITNCDEMKDFAYYMCADVEKNCFVYPSFKDDEGFRQLEYARLANDFCKAIDRLNERLSCGTPIKDVMLSLRKGVPHHTWYPQTHQVFLRTEDNWFIGAKGGSNGETHGHNDVGSFVLYADNEPLLVDPGVGTYTADTFGPNRFKIWSMTGAWHSVPAPNGIQQKEGKEYFASLGELDVTGKVYRFRTEISGAYPEQAACKQYSRTLTLKDSAISSSLVVEDSYELSQRTAADDIHFITPGKVTLSETAIQVENEGKIMTIKYSSNVKPRIEDKLIPEANLARIWNGHLYCIHFESAGDAPLTGMYRFEISIK